MLGAGSLSPYWNVDFWEFFSVLARRMISPGANLAPDELQILVLCCIAIACGLLGPLLVLGRMTMLANSLSHTILLGLAGSYFVFGFLGSRVEAPSLGPLLVGALAAGCLTVIATGALTHLFRLQRDASVGLVFTALFALGIVVVTIYLRDVHLCIEIIMGNVDALRLPDLMLAGCLALINALVIWLFFWGFQVIAFDPQFSVTLGVAQLPLHMILLFLTAATCVGAFRAVGVLIVLSFLTGPYLIARLFFSRLGPQLIAAPLIGCLFSLFGVALSRHILTEYGWPLSTGAIVASLIAILYPCLCLTKTKTFG